jgi:hypothetical protein
MSSVNRESKMMKTLTRAVVAALLMTMAGCLTEPKPLIDQFTWESVDNQNDITDGVTIAALFSDISFLGQVKTPTQCYRVTSKLTTSGMTLTVNIDVTNPGSTNCNQQPGGVRYTGVIQNLAKGTYTVHIIQNVSGVGTTEFTQTVKL